MCALGYRRILCAFLLICALAFPSLAKKKPPAHPINLNTASAAELQQVPGIGPATAEKILQMRKSYGAFKSVDDLRAVRGIGEKRLAKMRKYLVVGKPAQGKKAATPAEKKAPPVKSTTVKTPVAPKKEGAASEDEEP